MRAIVTAIVFFKQRTVCIINVWGRAEILPITPTSTPYLHLPAPGRMLTGWNYAGTESLGLG